MTRSATWSGSSEFRIFADDLPTNASTLMTVRRVRLAAPVQGPVGLPGAQPPGELRRVEVEGEQRPVGEVRALQGVAHREQRCLAVAIVHPRNSWLNDARSDAASPTNRCSGDACRNLGVAAPSAPSCASPWRVGRRSRRLLPSERSSWRGLAPSTPGQPPCASPPGPGQLPSSSPDRLETASPATDSGGPGLGRGRAACACRCSGNASTSLAQDSRAAI
jgi:hypothetical protein